MLIYAFIAVVSIVLTAQAAFTLGLMLYTWARPERLEESASPDEHLPPQLSFSAILPARHEEGVIGHTVRQVWESNGFKCTGKEFKKTTWPWLGLSRLRPSE